MTALEVIQTLVRFRHALEAAGRCMDHAELTAEGPKAYRSWLDNADTNLQAAAAELAKLRAEAEETKA